MIGYGSPIRCDDGVGYKIAQYFSERDTAFDVICSHQLLPEYAEDISRYGFVLFVDASVDVPCAEMVFEEVAARGIDKLDTHHLDPTSLLALSMQLYGKQPKAAIAKIGLCDDGLGEELSSKVQKRFDEYIDWIAQRMQKENLS